MNLQEVRIRSTENKSPSESNYSGSKKHTSLFHNSRKLLLRAEIIFYCTHHVQASSSAITTLLNTCHPRCPPPTNPILLRATLPEITHLEKPCRQTGNSSRRCILLQHQQCLCRRARRYLFNPLLNWISNASAKLSGTCSIIIVAFPPPSPSEETPIQTLESIVEQRQAQRKQDEASQQGAFNEETGEINWDCPCLGGMAHGPCGEDFRAAFSCFVFSKSEPKGMDCIDNFK